jgi:hypothetical protein
MLAHDLGDLRRAERSRAHSPRLPGAGLALSGKWCGRELASWAPYVDPRRSPLVAVGLWQAATAGSEEAQMATRPSEDGQATRKQGNGLAVATLGFGIAG